MRRASCLVAYWQDDEFVLENFLTGKQTAISPLLAGVLDWLRGYIYRDELLRRLSPLESARRLVRALVANDVLLVDGSVVERRDRLLSSSWEWGPSARFFHFATQRVTYETDLEMAVKRLAEHARAVPPPSPYKDSGTRALPLPGALEDARGEFWDVLRGRRTRRRFCKAPLTREQLATILLWTWGKTEERHSPQGGTYVLKTTPSGGARHPVEVYPVVKRVSGVSPGIYHYSVRRHALEYLRPAPSAARLVELFAGQPWVHEAAAVFFMTAVVERSMWKYKHEHAYRVLLLDCGHLGQTFHLVCTRLGLAPFTSSAKADTEIERELGLDGISEISLYAAATGVPARNAVRSQTKQAGSLQV